MKSFGGLGLGRSVNLYVLIIILLLAKTTPGLLARNSLMITSHVRANVMQVYCIAGNFGEH